MPIFVINNIYQNSTFKKDVDFMEAIREAKAKFANEKEEAQKNINKNLMSSGSEGWMKRKPPFKQYNQLTSEKLHNVRLYRNMMAMFRQDQEIQLDEILIRKLPTGTGRNHFHEITSEKFEVHIF
jgi:hypothetical protein